MPLPKRPTPWSLNKSSDLLALSIGSAIGVGNFYYMPALFLNFGGLSVLLIHIVGLLVLGMTLLIAELIWSRWLQRPYTKSSGTVVSSLFWLPWIGVFASALITPAYIVDVAKLFLLSITSLFSNGALESGFRSNIESSGLSLYFGAFSLFSLSILVCSRKTAFLAKLMKILLLFTSLALISVATNIGRLWGWTGFFESLSWDYSRLDSSSISKIMNFSLFTLSAGLGIHYTFVYYATQEPLSQKGSSTLFPVNVAGWVVLGDLIASILSLIIVSPFAVGAKLRAPAFPVVLILDWVPQILVSGAGGKYWVMIYLLGLGAAGFASLLSLINFLVFTLEKSTEWSRKKSVLHIFLVGIVLIAIPLFPKLSEILMDLGSNVLIPLSASSLAFMVGWKMPRKAQEQNFGRGYFLDELFTVWRLSIRYLVPITLLIITLQSTRALFI